jgi:5-methylcytosine-specific restriction enzyme subunit McrC
LEEADELAVGIEDPPRVEDLLARLLINGTRRLLRRGIDQNYLPQSEILVTVRGKIDFEVSTRRLLFEHRRVQCNFEEFLPTPSWILVKEQKSGRCSAGWRASAR